MVIKLLAKNPGIPIGVIKLKKFPISLGNELTIHWKFYWNQDWSIKVIVGIKRKILHMNYELIIRLSHKSILQFHHITNDS